MSELEDAFREMLDAQEEARGVRVKCKIAGKEYDFLAGDADVSIEFTSGGEGGGAISGQVLKSDFPNGQPAKFSSFEYEGEMLQILSAKNINGVSYEITAGDPASEDE